jgi:hypothetical protein
VNHPVKDEPFIWLGLVENLTCLLVTPAICPFVRR